MAKPLSKQMTALEAENSHLKAKLAIVEEKLLRSEEENIKNIAKINELSCTLYDKQIFVDITLEKERILAENKRKK